MRFKMMYRDRKGRETLLPRAEGETFSLSEVNLKITRCAEVWKEPPSMVYATSVFHSPGLSRAFFNHDKNDYIEAWRVPANC